VIALAKDGTPVTDLQPDEFELKEGGKTYPVVSAKIATSPMRVAIIVSDVGSGAFQAGVAYFIRDLLDHASFAVYSVLVQPERVVDYTNDPNTLRAAIGRLGPRARTAQGPQLMEALADVVPTVRGEAERSVVLVCRVGGESSTTLRSETVRKELARRGSVLYVVSTSGAQRPVPSQVQGTDSVAVQTGQLRDSEIADAAFQLQLVLGDGARESGGRHDQVVTTGMASRLQQIAKELNSQYRLVYELPEGVKPNERLSVSVKRKDVRVQAPSKIPVE
jgi:VWFA-related protein